jgi:hypothetical protein
MTPALVGMETEETPMDETEEYRRQRQAELNAEQADRAKLETTHGKVWSTDEMRGEFEALGFAAPFIIVKRKSDGKKGSLEFQHSPRFYFNWQEHK